MPEPLTIAFEGYDDLLLALKERIRTSQVRAALAVNNELVLLYWRIGRDIITRQEEHGWGAGFIARLSLDLRQAFPDMKGFSPRNLAYMRDFARTYPDESILQQVAAKLPWFHLCVLMAKVKDDQQRLWYAQRAIEYGWSRNVLAHHIETDLYHRQGKAITNFDRTLPAPMSELAQALLKDPYTFDFLSLGPEARERDIALALLTHIRRFLLELGAGFALVGDHYRLEVEGQEFFLDLLFYHLRLRCFVVIELKAGPFLPEHIGKLNFYCSVVDDQLRHPGDQPTIGMILCRDRKGLIVEYTLRDVHKPLGVAEYQLLRDLPTALQGSLPTVEELEAELRGGE